ncbi:hypothetical protein GCM10007291_38860 [Gemmobacter nanjingensis]|uniref:Addiction module antidote protein, CC2985 family n=1 Tax=Gemmobacter nanjingensis TaxID=488454 RepID=A0ABQ3FQL3_9RHOB|nr:hypothetical protein GCM10007291_38860 [Gemmobacter nanjingensis]
MTVCLSGAFSDFVAANVSENGSYENISEYVRDLIRRDKERAEQEAFDRLKAELTRPFAGPETSYKPRTAAEVIASDRACASARRPHHRGRTAAPSSVGPPPRLDTPYRIAGSSWSWRSASIRIIRNRTHMLLAAH